MQEADWRGVYSFACDNCPIHALLVQVLEERIRSDIEFKNKERKAEFWFLSQSTNNIALPFLLEIIPQVPVSDDQQEDILFKILKNMARPEDVPLIEKHYRDKAQEVPLMLQEPLRELKERQKRNAAVP